MGFIPIDLDKLGEVDFSTENISGYHAIIAQWDQYRMLTGVKVDRQPIHEAWKSRLGSFRPLNPQEADVFRIKKFELKIEDGYLVEALTFPDSIHTKILRTVNDQEAITEGLGRNLGETVRMVNDREGEILTFSGLRFKRITE